MGRRLAGREAFTLVELLVVIAILALLLAMLVPVITRARLLAQRAVCQSVFRELGTATHGFAAAHEGRAPGCGGGYPYLYLPVSDPNHFYYTGPNWTTILNTEYYHSTRATLTVYLDEPLRSQQRRTQLTCPSVLRPSGWTWTYLYWIEMNNDVQGCDRGSPRNPTYGFMTPIPPAYRSSYSYLSEYHLGTRLMNFTRPSWQIMHTESEETGNATLLPSHAAERVDPGDPANYDPARPGYIIGPGHHHIFRHLGTSVFSFIDGHSEALGPLDQLDTLARYTFRQP